MCVCVCVCERGLGRYQTLPWVFRNPDGMIFNTDASGPAARIYTERLRRALIISYLFIILWAI